MFNELYLHRKIDRQRIKFDWASRNLVGNLPSYSLMKNHCWSVPTMHKNKITCGKYYQALQDP